MSKEAMKLALEALLMSDVCDDDCKCTRKLAIKALEEALAKQEQGEPVAWQERQARRMQDGVVTEWTNWYPCRYRTIDEAQAEACDHIPYEWRPLYTTPQQRTWVGLTDDEIRDAIKQSEKVAIGYAGWVGEQRLIWGRAIEAKLKEKNNA